MRKANKTKRFKKEQRPPEYFAWAKEVKELANYTCQTCGCTDRRKLHSHHIKPWSKYPHLRYSLKNGICICKACHVKLHPEYRNLMLGKEGKKRRILNSRIKSINKASKRRLITSKF